MVQIGLHGDFLILFAVKQIVLFELGFDAILYVAPLERQKRHIKIDQIRVDYGGMPEAFIVQLFFNIKNLFYLKNLKIYKIFTFIKVNRLLYGFLKGFQLELLPLHIVFIELQCPLNNFFRCAITIWNKLFRLFKLVTMIDKSKNLRNMNTDRR